MHVCVYVCVCVCVCRAGYTYMYTRDKCIRVEWLLELRECSQWLMEGKVMPLMEDRSSQNIPMYCTVLHGVLCEQVEDMD